MKVRTSVLRGFALLALSTLTFAACEDKTTTPVTPPVVTVSVTPSAATLPVGQRTTFVAIVSGNANQSVTWASSTQAVATVNATTGEVTAVAPGTTVITATSVADPTKRDAAVVTVIPAPPSAVTIRLVPEAASIGVGQSIQLVSIVEGTANAGVTYRISPPTGVATVSATGLVTGTAQGTAVVTAIAAADTTKKATSVITVTQVPAGPGVAVSISPTAATIQTGANQTFTAFVTGSTNTAVQFRSADPAIATINATTGVATGVGAGTTTITAIAAADTTKRVTATLTVTAAPPIVVTVTPTTATGVVGGTQDFTAVVTGTTNTAITCVSQTPAVATTAVNGQTCTATAASAGTAVIRIASVADPTKFFDATFTVSPVTAPSISIQSVVNAATGANVAPGTTTGGVLNVTVNVTAGSQTSLDSVQVQLNGTRCVSQNFSPPLAPTQGVAMITLVCNTAQLSAGNNAVFPNGTYTLSAVAFAGSGAAAAAVATATYGSITLANTNVVTGVVTFDNSLNDTDNDPATNAVASGGVLWNGGAATVTLTTAVFTGTPIATITVALDTECDGVIGAGNAIRTVTIAGGTGSVTFSEAASMTAATPGIDNLQDSGVCFLVSAPADAAGLPIALPATGGAGNVVAAGTAGTNATQGPGQNVFAIDNVEPTFPAAVALPPSLVANNSYAGVNTVFSTATVVGAAATDPASGGFGVLVPPATNTAGVGIVSVRFVAVPAGTAAATQANMAAAVASAGAVEITSGGQLPSSSISNAAYILIVEAKDALGNVVYGNAGTFGVDLENPTIAVCSVAICGVTSLSTNGTINSLTDITVAVTDTFSGPISLRFRATNHSVLEVNATAATEQRCIVDAAGTLGAAPSTFAGGVCPWITVAPLTNIAGQTEFGTVIHPDASGAQEGYYVYEIQGVDRAGNFSLTTATFTTLNDVTVPTATINIITTNIPAGTTQITGVINENVDLAAYDTRFQYVGLPGVPDEVPFVAPTNVDSYGLPLTGVLAVDAISSTTVRDITDQAGVNYVAGRFGFGAWDVAGNPSSFAASSNPLTNTAGPGVVGTFLNAAATDFDASFNARADAAGATNAQCIDRSGNGGAACPASTTIWAQVRVATTAANPIATVYFYIVNPGADNAFGTADDFNVLVAQTSAASVITGQTDRTFAFSAAVSPTILPRIGTPTAYPMFAIGVAANGSAVMSDVVTLTIQD